VRLQHLADQTWTHPQTGRPLRLGYSTIAHWYDRARRAADPMRALRRQVRCDRAATRAMTETFADTLRTLYQQHPQWTGQLLYDNVLAVLRERSAGEPLPSYPTVRRFMRAQGMVRRRRLDGSGTDRARAAERRFTSRVVERYECTHVGALLHWDFHIGSRAVADARCGLVQPRLLAFLDDHSRFVVHAQWYLEETARVVAHAFVQAASIYGLPRAVLSDNGGAMQAAEIREGFDRLAVAHRHTQVYSPYQNGKMECFWGQVEGRLLPMIGADRPLDLAELNRLTMAWLSQEYYRSRHSTTGVAPWDRWQQSPSVMRAAWTWTAMQQAFTARVTRKVRASIGTVSLDGVDFDLPPAYRHLERVTLRAARWDRSRAWLCDPRDDTIITMLLPADPAARADGRRRLRQPPAPPGASSAATPSSELSPLLQHYLNDHQRDQPLIAQIADRPPSTPPGDTSCHTP